MVETGARHSSPLSLLSALSGGMTQQGDPFWLVRRLFMYVQNAVFSPKGVVARFCNDESTYSLFAGCVIPSSVSEFTHAQHEKYMEYCALLEKELQQFVVSEGYGENLGAFVKELQAGVEKDRARAEAAFSSLIQQQGAGATVRLSTLDNLIALSEFPVFAQVERDIALEKGDASPASDASTAASMSVAVPDGVAGGSPLLVETPDLQQLEVIVPEGLGPGDVFAVNYVPLSAFSVVLPEGYSGGATIEVLTPDAQRLAVVVPDGLQPGMEFAITYVPLCAY